MIEKVYVPCIVKENEMSSEKLVIGRHLLLSRVSTVVNPACTVIAHNPNPIHEEMSQCSLMYHKSTSCSDCGRTSV